MSVGVLAIDPRHARADEALRLADAAMYGYGIKRVRKRQTAV